MNALRILTFRKKAFMLLIFDINTDVPEFRIKL